MESKSINRYHTFCKSLENLKKSLTADPTADFVLEGTVLTYCLTFDISWKVMKDILIKEMGILDFATGSPRETLQQAFTNHLIDDDRWIEMMKVMRFPQISVRFWSSKIVVKVRKVATLSMLLDNRIPIRQVH